MNISMNMNFSSLPPGLPGLGTGQAMGMLGQQQALMMQMTQIMMTLFMQLMSTPAGAMTPLGGAFGGGAGAGGMNPGIGNFLGSGGGGGFGGTPALGSGASGAAVNNAPPAANGSGEAAVAMARKYLGRDSISLKGDMPHFTAAGGVTNNCVDFVSSALESQGLVKGHHINVRAFEKELQKQGWVQIPENQAKPGDVWINHSRGHTELVATAGATRLIGSNGSARQKVTEHANRPGSGVIYSKR